MYNAVNPNHNIIYKTVSAGICPNVCSKNHFNNKSLRGLQVELNYECIPKTNEIYEMCTIVGQR